MFRIIGSSMLVLGLLLGTSQAAEAHGAAQHRYDSTGYHYRNFHRRQHMPRWLWHKRGFRHWYFRTPLRFDYRLTWSQLHDAYRWERRHPHRRYRLHYGPRHYSNNPDRRDRRDRRYWRDDDRQDRRPNQRRRHRND